MTTPRRRVACYVLRGRELLVFDHVDHPDAGTQIPAGGVLAGEAVAAAALREVAEECGVEAEYVDALGDSHRPHPESGRAQHTTYVLCRTTDPRDEWLHVVGGDGDDEGMRFRCWFAPLPLDGVALAGGQDEFLDLLTRERPSRPTT